MKKRKTPHFFDTQTIAEVITHGFAFPISDVRPIKFITLENKLYVRLSIANRYKNYGPLSRSEEEIFERRIDLFTQVREILKNPNALKLQIEVQKLIEAKHKFVKELKYEEASRIREKEKEVTEKLLEIIRNR